MHICQLPFTVNLVDALRKPLSSDIFHGLLEQYIYRKPKIHKKTQIIIASLVKRVNYMNMNKPLHGEESSITGFTTIINGHKLCVLGKEMYITKMNRTKMIKLVSLLSLIQKVE